MGPVWSGPVTALPERVEAPRLNPAQQQILDELGSTARPRFRDDLRDHLRHELDVALGPLGGRLSAVAEDGVLYLSKHRLNQVHGCEARFLAEEAIPFAWTVASARGTVVHKAIELLVGRRGRPTPLDLVDEALSRLEPDERSIGPFLAGLTEAERADLVTRANEVVAGFLDAFPPLRRTWVPVAESRVRAEFCDGRIVLQGAVDLTLGRARGTEAGKVLIDLKTGRTAPSHVDDLRFYALLETLKLGTPPRMIVTYYLETGRPRTEQVTEELLWSTLHRVVDGAERALSLLHEQGEPRLVPGAACRWCPLIEGCPTGQRQLAASDDEPEP
jgi:RecB family exonuclease